MAYLSHAKSKMACISQMQDSIFKAKHKTQNMAIAKQKLLQSVTRCI
jgi:hypothetical protein